MLQIVAETEDWIVVDKPPFLLVHPSKPGGPRTLWHDLNDLLAYELANGGQVSIVNRLDRETSGVMLICKHARSARRFGLLMEGHGFVKRYLALVWGWPESDRFSVDAPILRQGAVRHSPIYLKQCVHPDGAAALTEFHVLRRFTASTTAGSKFALVEAAPKTGRMHQIRVHLSQAGHPLLGDKIYGPDEQCYLRFIETGWTQELERLLLLPRHALHATALEVPAEGLNWKAAFAPDLRNWLSKNSPETVI